MHIILSLPTQGTQVFHFASCLLDWLGFLSDWFLNTDWPAQPGCGGVVRLCVHRNILDCWYHCQVRYTRMPPRCSFQRRCVQCSTLQFAGNWKSIVGYAACWKCMQNDYQMRWKYGAIEQHTSLIQNCLLYFGPTNGCNNIDIGRIFVPSPHNAIGVALIVYANVPTDGGQHFRWQIFRSHFLWNSASEIW